MANLQHMPPFAQNPWGLQHCMYHFTYMWLRNGDNFWFFLTTVSESRASGFRFFGGRWNPYSIALRDIVFFNCSPTPTLY